MLAAIFVWLFVVFSLQASITPSSQNPETFAENQYVSCNVCNGRFTAGDSFLRHARSVHPSLYDAHFYRLTDLYTNIFTETCAICNFAVTRDEMGNHYNTFHFTSAISGRPLRHSTPSLSPAMKRNLVLAPKIYKRQTVLPLRSQEYLQRFGPEIPCFDQYISNIQTLQAEKKGSTSISDKSGSDI